MKKCLQQKEVWSKCVLYYFLIWTREWVLWGFFCFCFVWGFLGGRGGGVLNYISLWIICEYLYAKNEIFVTRSFSVFASKFPCCISRSTDESHASRLWLHAVKQYCMCGLQKWNAELSHVVNSMLYCLFTIAFVIFSQTKKLTDTQARTLCKDIH